MRGRPPCAGIHPGLIAGCTFAKDILKAFLLLGARRPLHRHFWDYGDDITMRVEAATPGEAPAALREDLGDIKSALRADTMHFHDAKDQLYGPTVAGRNAWAA